MARVIKKHLAHLIHRRGRVDGTGEAQLTACVRKSSQMGQVRIGQ